MQLRKMEGESFGMDELNVIYSSDDNYEKYMGVSITSLLENAKDYKINVKIIELGIQDVSKLKGLENQYNCSIELIDFSAYKDILKLSKNEWDLSISSYARLLISKMMPSLDRALYIDCDTIICGDIMPFYNTDLRDNYAAGVIDTASNETKKKTGMDLIYPYVNAGILLLNLKKWKEDNVIERFLDYIDQCAGKVFHHDQGIINHVFQGKVKIVDPVYNSMTPYHITKYDNMIKIFNVQETYYSEKQIIEAKNNPVIIHFTEAFCTRPWYRNCSHPMKNVFDNYRKISNWSDMQYLKDQWSFKQRLVAIIYRTLPYEIASKIIYIHHILRHGGK